MDAVGAVRGEPIREVPGGRAGRVTWREKINARVEAWVERAKVRGHLPEGRKGPAPGKPRPFVDVDPVALRAQVEPHRGWRVI